MIRRSLALLPTIFALSLSSIADAQTTAAAQTTASDSIYLGNDRILTRRPERRFCGEASAPVGILKGEVEIQFVLGPDGRPDTSSAIVLRASRFSSRTALSAARRLLINCQFRPGEVSGRPVATLVVQRIEFKELKIIVDDGRSRPNHGAVGLAHQPSRARSDTVYLETDQLLEEKPTRFQCRNPQQLVSQQGLTVEERLVFANRYGGILQVSFVVLPSGIYDPLTFRRERGPASDMENMLKQQAEACLYLPGRIDGVPVSVRVYGYPGDIINLSR